MSKPIEASIVVVDDEPSIRELLVASLHFAGFEVNTAASGSEAIEVIEKIQPDLIVLDVMLPDIDGFTVTRIFPTCVRRSTALRLRMRTARSAKWLHSSKRSVASAT